MYKNKTFFTPTLSCTLILLLSIYNSSAFAQSIVEFDYKGCRIVLEGPLVTFGSTGTDNVSALVRSFGSNCNPQWLRLRHERRFWFDRNLITVNNSGSSDTIIARYNCKRGGGMRVFAEARVLGKKFRSKPRKGISVPLCH